ncbi:hypothetical protein [Thermococcus sp.]
MPFLVVPILLMPPPITGPNVEFSLHLVTGCKNVKDSEEGITCSCNEIIAYSTAHVSGIAWKSLRFKRPVVGGFVTVYEPKGKAEKSYRETIERVESRGYTKLVENYGTDSDVIKDVLFSREKNASTSRRREFSTGLGGNLCKGGPCRGVKAFALRGHDDYLWNASEPQIFGEYRFNWSQTDGISVGKFAPSDWPDEWVRNTYKAIAIELKGTGYVKILEGKSGKCE